jgi:hypothetical protein
MLDPDDTQALLAWKQSLDSELQTAIEIVMASGNRSIYAFYETYAPATTFVFTTVPDEYLTEVATVSTIGVGLDIAIDDVADQVIDRQESQAVIDRAISVIKGESTTIELYTEWGRRKAMAFEIVWALYRRRIQAAPCFDQYCQLWQDEWLKLIGSMQYSLDVNTDPHFPYVFDTALEQLAPNMHLVIKHVIDLCYSPSWDEADTTFALAFARQAEKIMRISNWLRSWRQELRQAEFKQEQGLRRDISSGVFAMAVTAGVVTQAALFEDDTETLIRRIESGGVEDTLRAYAIWLAHNVRASVDVHLQVRGDGKKPFFVDFDIYGDALNRMTAEPHLGGNQPR